MNIETNEKSEWYLVHVSAHIHTEEFKEFFLCRVVHEDKPVEELESVVGEDEDEEVVVDQLHHRPLPHRHQLEEARHAARGVLVLVLVDVQVGVVLLVHRHLQHRALLTIASLAYRTILCLCHFSKLKLSHVRFANK